MSGIERRRYRRANIITEAEIVSGKETLLAPTRDISIGGMFLHTTTKLPNNTEVRLRFSLEPGTPVIEAMGRVVYAVPRRGLGIEFSELREEDRARIESFIARAEVQPTPTDELPIP